MNEVKGKRARVRLGSEEKRYLLTVLLIACLVFVFRRAIFEFAWLISLALPGILLSVVLFKVLAGNGSLREVLGDQLTLVPFMHAEGGEKRFIPKVTILLILLNVLVHYFVKTLPLPGREHFLNTFCFLPDPVTWWNLPLSAFTSMFLHGDDGHLWGNMVFLWAFGPAVEERVGPKIFVIFYFFTGLSGKLLSWFIFETIMLEELHSLGASGAIAGIMGVFMVRCYFKRLVIPLPLFGLVHYRLRINSLFMLGYFFLRDVNGGFRLVGGSDSSINYWAHIGSMAAGILLALRSRQHVAAAKEKYVAIGIDAMDKPNFYKDGAGALRRALELDPENETALLALARNNAISRKPEGKEQFEKVIAARLKNDPKGAAELYRECLATYKTGLAPALQYRLAGILYRLQDLHEAMRALEMLIDKAGADAHVREQALVQLVAILTEAGLHGPARHRLEQFAAAFPQSPLLPGLRSKVPADSDGA